MCRCKASAGSRPRGNCWRVRRGCGCWRSARTRTPATCATCWRRAGSGICPSAPIRKCWSKRCAAWRVANGFWMRHWLSAWRCRRWRPHRRGLRPARQPDGMAWSQRCRSASSRSSCIWPAVCRRQTSRPSCTSRRARWAPISTTSSRRRAPATRLKSPCWRFSRGCCRSRPARETGGAQLAVKARPHRPFCVAAASVRATQVMASGTS